MRIHPAHAEDLPTITDTVAVVGMAIFLLLIVGTCLYLVWRLPRDSDDGP